MTLQWIDPQYSPTLLAPHGALAMQWDRLARDTAQADPFCCSSGWHMPFQEAFSPERPLLWLLDGQNLCLFAESRNADTTLFLTPVEAHWGFGNPLMGTEAPLLFKAALPLLQRHYAPHFPRIVLSGIPANGPHARNLVRTLGRHFAMYLYEACDLCTASLEGGLDGFLSRRSGNHRAKLKKARKHAAANGVTFTRVCPRTPEAAEATYARMLAVEVQSWKGIGHCGMAETPAKEFYAAMLRRLALTADARVIFARKDDTDIGFIYGALAGTVYRGQQFSYSDAWRQASIGNILQYEQVAWLCEEGATRYDMGPITGPRMAYKAHWTEQRQTIQTWVLERI